VLAKATIVAERGAVKEYSRYLPIDKTIGRVPDKTIICCFLRGGGAEQMLWAKLQVLSCSGKSFYLYNAD